MKQYRVEIMIVEDHNEGEDVDITDEEVLQNFATYDEAREELEKIYEQYTGKKLERWI